MSSYACLVILKLAFGQLFLFNNTRASVCVLVCASSCHLLLVLPPHPSLISSCFSCHIMIVLFFLKLAFGQLLFLITHGFLSVYLSVHPLVISCLFYHLLFRLSTHDSLVILCLSCHDRKSVWESSIFNLQTHLFINSPLCL